MAKALSLNIASSFSTSMDPVPAFEMKNGASLNCVNVGGLFRRDPMEKL